MAFAPLWLATLFLYAATKGLNAEVGVIVYGLSNCSTCREAVKSLEAAGKDVTFRDVRKAPLSDAELAVILAKLGAAAVNRRARSWQNLSDEIKAAEPDVQIRADPRIMKRPLIQDGGTFHLGWNAKVRALLLGQG